MQTITSSITVVIADDHEVTRVGIRTILQKVSGITIVGEAADGTGAQQLIECLKPHVALLDLIMPGITPADITMWAYQHHPETAVLILTAHSRDYYLAQMLHAGAAGYLDKNERGAGIGGGHSPSRAGAEAVYTRATAVRASVAGKRASDLGKPDGARAGRFTVACCWLEQS